MRNEVVALVPVREGSTRVKNKNFKPFGGYKNLLDLKISQLKTQTSIDKIYISSDSKQARALAEEHGVDFLDRDPYYCSSKAKLYEYNSYMLSTVPGDPHVVWAMVTSPLFSNYNGVVDKYLESIGANDSLVTVMPYNDFLIDRNGRPINCAYGHWHLLTQELQEAYQISGAAYIAKKSDQLEWRYWIGLKPQLFEISKLEAIEVDYPSDFQIAEALFHNLLND
jgi:CMP-N-acetylneuraminic acid synthetase